MLLSGYPPRLNASILVGGDVLLFGVRVLESASHVPMHLHERRLGGYLMFSG